MPTKKDLIEAQSFSRRRLLTAFTSGAPAGKELEPAAPLRAVIAGVVLAVMVVLGGVVYGLTRPTLQDGWDNNSVILVEDTGARYVSLEGVLYPVLNATSARLLLPAGSYNVITAKSDALKNVPVGPAVGILGAPDDVPDADDLVADGWTACPVGEGTGVALPGDATPASETDASLVTADGVQYVLVDDTRYPLEDDSADQVLRQLGLAGLTPRPVDSRWLNLFEEGSPLAPMFVDGQGETIVGTELPVGAVVHPQGSTAIFVVTADGELAALSPVAYQLYLLGTGAKLGGEREVTAGEIADLPNAAAPAGAADWPAEELRPIDQGLHLCAVLDHDELGDAVTTLATSEIPAAEGVVVAPHSGALVVATGRGSSPLGSLALIDESGTSFPLPLDEDEVLARLGYAEADVTTVPLVWTQFFASGPALTIAAAGTSPDGTAPALPSASPGAGANPSASATDPSAAPSVGPSAGPGATPSPGAGTSADAAVDADDDCEPGREVKSEESPEALAQLQSARAWDLATGAGITIAVVDSGIDVTNPHLADAVVGGIDLVGDGLTADGTADVNGHGTAVAGAIAARDVEGSGVKGLAPEADLLSVRVFRGTDDESVKAGFGPNFVRIAQGIVWAVDNGATIINVSMSDDHPSQALESAVDYATAHGVLVVASAGNRATTENKEDSPRYPAAYEGALAVAAADPLGDVTDSTIHGAHVDVSAPGQAVRTATLGGIDCVYAGGAPSSSYATAYASAAAALVAQHFPDETPAQWMYRLEASALRHNPDARDDMAGWGLVQPFDALMLEPGTDQRGPVSPFFDVDPVTVNPEGTSVSAVTVESPWGATRAAAIGGGVVAAMALLGFGVLSLARREPDPVAPETGRKGLLDDQKDSATRVV